MTPERLAEMTSDDARDMTRLLIPGAVSATHSELILARHELLAEVRRLQPKLTDDEQKERILRDAGFLFYFPRGVYVNKAKRIAITVERVQSWDLAHLRTVAQLPEMPEWLVVCVESFSPHMRESLIAQISGGR